MLLTDGMASDRFLVYGNHAVAREGERLRGILLKFLKERLAAGARPHLIFLWLSGGLPEAIVDGGHAVRVPIRMLDEKLRSMARFPIMDSSELIEVAVDTENDNARLRLATRSHVLVDISSENAAAERDSMRWTGNVDVLVDETLFSFGPSRGSLLLLTSLQELADAIRRLRDGARAVSTTLTGDTASLRFVRSTSGGVHAAVVVYRAVESTPVPVPELDAACCDAVRCFLNSVPPEQYAQLNSEQAAKVLQVISTTWPEAVPQHMSWKQ